MIAVGDFQQVNYPSLSPPERGGVKPAPGSRKEGVRGGEAALAGITPNKNGQGKIRKAWTLFVMC